MRDFGAIPGDDQSDGEAVRKCIQTALDCAKKAEVVFEAGTYRIDPAPGATSMGELVSLPINKANNLALSGAREGTTFVFTNPSASGIVFEGCRNIRLKDIRIDYDPLPFAFGTIRAMDLKEQTFDFELDNESIDLTHSAFTKARGLWGIVVRPDPKHDTIHYGPIVVGARTTIPLGNRLWRLTVKEDAGGYANALTSSGMKPGDRFVYIPRTYGSAVGIQNCEDVQAEGITIFSTPGLNFFPYLSRAVSLLDCHVKVKEGRLLSGNADGIHARGLRGDLLIENCSFEGMADDAINVHSSAILITEVRSPTEIVAPPHTWSVRPGDRLALYDANLTPKGLATVANQNQSDGQILIRFTEPLEGLRIGRGDRFYNLSEAGGPFIVRKCRFLSHRGRGVLISAINGRIEDNTFENNEGWGVVLDFGDARWAEGPPAHGLQIIGNVFTGRGGPQPCIVAQTTAPKEIGMSGRRFFRDLTIKENTFLNISAPAIRLSGVEGAIIENNTLLEKTTAVGPVSFPAVELENSAGILIGNLEILDSRFKTGVLIGTSVESGEGGVRFGSSDKALPVIDKRIPPEPTAP